MSNPAQKAAERICGGIVAATPDRIAAIIRTAYAPLLQRAEAVLVDLKRRCDSLPSYRACECGGDPHEGRPCGQGACECQEFSLRDAAGHALAERVDTALAALREALGERNEP